MQEMQIWSLGLEEPLEEEMATHSSILTWKIPWIKEPGGVAKSQTGLSNWALHECYIYLSVLSVYLSDTFFMQ